MCISSHRKCSDSPDEPRSIECIQVELQSPWQQEQRKLSALLKSSLEQKQTSSLILVSWGQFNNLYYFYIWTKINSVQNYS